MIPGRSAATARWSAAGSAASPVAPAPRPAAPPTPPAPPAPAAPAGGDTYRIDGHKYFMNLSQSEEITFAEVMKEALPTQASSSRTRRPWTSVSRNRRPWCR